MRKQKPPRYSPSTFLMLASLISGIVLLIGLSAFGIWRWVNTSQPTAFPTGTPLPTVIYDMPGVPTEAPMPPPAPSWLPDDASFVFTTLDYQIGSVTSGSFPTYWNIRGVEVSAAPDGKMLASIFQGQLSLHVESGENREVTLPGQVLTATWSPDSKALSVVISQNNNEILYRLSPLSMESFVQWTLPHFAVHPIWHPSTKRILIAEMSTDRGRTLYTIDADCGSLATCKASREWFTDIPYETNWMTFHRSGTLIVFSDVNGRLYQLNTAITNNGLKKIEPLLNNGRFKQRPTFSPDGLKLLYLDNLNHAYVVRLEDMAVFPVMATNDNYGYTFNSIDWKP